MERPSTAGDNAEAGHPRCHNRATTAEVLELSVSVVQQQQTQQAQQTQLFSVLVGRGFSDITSLRRQLQE